MAVNRETKKTEPILKGSERNNEIYKEMEYDGNAARQLEVAPQILPQHPQPEQPLHQPKQRPSRRPSQRQLEKNRQRALAMSTGELLCLSFSVIILLVAAISYMQVHTSVDKQLVTISSTEKSINTLRVQNDLNEMSINASIDYNAIYEIAVKELGMCYPGKDQVLHYQTSEAEYFEMNTSIPD